MLERDAELAQRDVMLAQLAAAFIADDMPRFREAAQWLIAFVERRRGESGRLHRGKRWFDPIRFAVWQNERKKRWAQR